MRVLCPKCERPAETINRGLLTNKGRGHVIVCLKDGYDEDGNHIKYGGCGHTEIIHRDEFERLKLLPLEQRKVIPREIL